MVIVCIYDYEELSRKYYDHAVIVRVYITIDGELGSRRVYAMGIRCRAGVISRVFSFSRFYSQNRQISLVIY